MRFFALAGFSETCRPGFGVLTGVGIWGGAAGALFLIMRILARYFDNPFDDPGISLAELLAFSTDHLGRLRARNAQGEFAEPVAALESALAGLNEASMQDFSNLGLRKARKRAKRDFRRKLLPGALEKVDVAVLAFLEGGRNVRQRAFPQGRTIFRTCADDHLRAHLRVMDEVVQEHAAALPPAIVELSAGLLAQWQEIYSGSESSTGAKAAAEVAQRQARAVLQGVLFDNLLLLARRHAREPDRLADYMQESLLRDRVRRVRKGAAAEP